MPYAIAPQEQTRVPLVMWFFNVYAKSRAEYWLFEWERARSYADHDALFSSVLGLFRLKQVPLKEVLRYPLALGDPAVCEGHARQIDRFLRKLDQGPLIAQRVATFDG
ncbi:Dynein heavy chain 1, axonemal [Manis javanica]|nr:Dynein heavy chain 1, axonemal [Manis javanica]